MGRRLKWKKERRAGKVLKRDFLGASTTTEDEVPTTLKPCKYSVSTVPSSSEPPEDMEEKPTNKGIGKAIFILENALLKKGFVRKKWKILDSEEDADFLLLKQNKNLHDYMPSIVYKALRKILDSPLNKAGMVGAVYVKIDQGLLFEIKPHVRIPRTLDRFCGIMLELLEKSCIRTKDTNEVLIRVIEEPVTRHLPINSRIIGVSHTSEKLVDIKDYVSSATDDLNLVIVVGTTVHGKINEEYLNDFISVSNYPSVARFSLGAICNALERKWKIF